MTAPREGRAAGLKLAIVRQRYNPYGGAERFVERALAALAGAGAEITLITRSWEGSAEALGAYQQIVCDPPARALLSRRLARDRAFAAGVQAILATRHFDLVQSHERIPGCSIFRAGDGVHAAWLEYRARLLSPLQRLAQRWSPYHRQMLAAEAAMFAHPALRTVICNSQMVADEIVRFYGVDRSRLQVIYNGVDTDDFHPRLCDLHRASQRQALGIPEPAPVLIYVGSGYQRKGVPQLLRAFARAARQDAHLLLIGADRKLKAMRRLAGSLGIGERCHFLGPVRDVRPYYGAADGFVLPTIYDPGPNAALEAMACGLPMLTSHGCGAREWINEGVNGCVVDVFDDQAMTAGLDRLVELALTPAAHAAARAAVAHLDLAGMADRLLELYGRLADHAAC